MNKVISLALFVAATVAVSSAIKCYSCLANNACGDPFTSGTELDCLDGITTCLKTKGGANGNSAVVRTCGAPGLSTGCSKVKVGGVSIEYCICEGDKCNSAGFAKVSLVALVATLAVPFVLLNLTN